MPKRKIDSAVLLAIALIVCSLIALGLFLVIRYVQANLIIPITIQ